MKAPRRWSREQDAALKAIAESGKSVTWAELIAVFGGAGLTTIRRHARNLKLNLNVTPKCPEQPETGGVDKAALKRILGGLRRLS